MFNSKLKNAFPLKYSEEVKYIMKKIPKKMFKNELTNGYKVTINHEEIYIPGRVYFEEISKEIYDEFTPIQKTIVDCIYTRHENGFIREKYLENLLRRGHMYYWITPYFISLSAEYVIEILNLLKKYLPRLDDNFIRMFFEENGLYFNLTEQRIISYWNCYYKEYYPIKNEYVGFQLLYYYKNCLQKKS